ncbi:MAG: peptide chain release factor N(5)-glutamine methyltransferase [Phycisphaerales bacterium]
MDGPWTVLKLLRWIQRHLEEKDVDSPRVSAEILISHVLECERLRLYMEPDRVPSDAERARLRELVARAARHEPVQYLVGTWPFRGRTFEVGPATLIPRPATETLVEAAVRWYRDAMWGRPLRMADIGTGTGVIAVSVIAEIRDALDRASGQRGCRPLGGVGASGRAMLPEIQRADVTVEHIQATRVETAEASAMLLRCVAVDVVPAAVELARRNIERHGLAAEIEVRAGSLFEPFASAERVESASLDLICANPPYVSDAEWADVLPNVKNYEPATALRAGRDGLSVIAPLLRQAPTWLRQGGMLMVEIADSQPDSVRAILRERQDVWDDVQVLKDHENLWRVLVARRG